MKASTSNTYHKWKPLLLPFEESQHVYQDMVLCKRELHILVWKWYPQYFAQCNLCKGWYALENHSSSQSTTMNHLSNLMRLHNPNIRAHHGGTLLRCVISIYFNRQRYKFASFSFYAFCALPNFSQSFKNVLLFYKLLHSNCRNIFGCDSHIIVQGRGSWRCCHRLCLQSCCWDNCN